MRHTDVTQPLAGQVALVTGSGRGIGAAIALGLARAGATVALSSRSPDQLAAVKAQIEALGGTAEALVADLSEPDGAERLVARTIAAFGRLDVLVANAAAPSVIAPIVDMPIDGWRQVQAINLDATFALLKFAGPHMLARGSGSVIIVSSTLGLAGNPNSSAYGASKAALNHLARTAAAEWGPRGVRVNALLPGPTATERVRAVTDDPVLYAAIAGLMPLGRWPTAEDMVGPALFLASDASACITGQLLIVDSGIGAVAREAGLARPAKS